MKKFIIRKDILKLIRRGITLVSVATTVFSLAGCKSETTKDDSFMEEGFETYSYQAYRKDENSSDGSKYIKETAEPEFMPTQESAESVIIQSSTYIESKEESKTDVSNLSSEESKSKITSDDVIDYLEKIDDKMMEKGYQAKDELVKDYGIVHDFIFEDGTIKGYTFDELKDSAKAKALSIYLKIDEKIESHFPEYKEKIKEKYGNTKEKVKTKLSEYKNKLIDYLKDELGEEKYNSYVNKKDKFVDAFKEQTKEDFNELKELGKSAWEKIKER